ncbi:methyl-accepting chemotaxis protein [Paenibacillus sp. SEL3]|jgi:methyl-accepting chemotaxis protein|uniref:Methyl-accepting chemotaxis protein n=1 Tax=Paenibacillus polymyxa TaxID=1406 RepID=A0A8I1J511_PAEPO|nr:MULTISPECIES: HAMP domain-containing methyl-accepting chemotaxis protein [Paenibacillus]KAF6570613.1 methyl-accepting chemotaxis protein [Paenibacillus sp. EKM206P]KAF6588073.1 methyl-accepting chemotaxis protein [Paenibacillus sp. EKM205P]KEO76763.1 chemotaxis protein [Paenibacillus polymyxa]MBM0635880.1 methyl-accepting chemotaxis protein [Paenibacillus polymyxa]MBP1312075.1 methyl-accepting chemotaxis protein [Paenibacillus sp. 1182]
MKLQGKLVLNAMISLIACLALVAYIIFELIRINSQSSNLVPAMLNVQQLNAYLIQSGQALQNYSASMTESNKADVQNQLTQSEKTIALLSQGMMQTEEQQKRLNTIKTKFSQLKVATEKAMSTQNSPESKREAMRAQGIQNDVFMLDLLTKARYDQYTEDLTKSIRFTWQLALAGAVLLLVAVGLYNTYTSRQLALRTRKLTDAAKQIAEGNLTVQLAQTKGRDELDELNESFRVMIGNLRSIVLSIDQAGNRVDLMARDIDHHNEAMKEIVTQVSTSTEELAIGSQKIAEDLSSTVGVVDEMQQKFESNLLETTQSTAYSEDALRVIEQGTRVMSDQLRIVAENRSAMSEVEQTVKELEANAAEITTMTGYVSEIASQTSLLSLNASIEAARAGEAGKGFAVVANEVKKLANQSESAVKKIYTAVDGITQAMDKVKTSVAQSQELFREQEKATSSTGESFTEISGKVQQIAGQVSKLSTDMNVSRELSVQVQQAIENISAITQQSAAGSEEITASTVEQKRSFEESAEKVKELRQIREEMQRELDRFQVEKTS